MQGDVKSFEAVVGVGYGIDVRRAIGRNRPSSDWLKKPEQPSLGRADVDFLNDLFFQEQDDEAEDMAGPTREEIDAKLAASEARNDTKIARLDGKLDQVLERLDGVKLQMVEVRNDGRSTRSTLWAVCAIIVTVILAAVALLVAVTPAAFTAGVQVRDMVQKEVQIQQTQPKAP